jgi:hypothetical protein
VAIVGISAGGPLTIEFAFSKNENKRSVLDYIDRLKFSKKIGML